MSSSTRSIEELESMTRRAAPARTRWSVALLRRLAIRLVSLAAFVALWELASDSKARFIVNFAHVPAPSAVAEAAVHFFQSPKAVRHIASSIKRVAAGFGIATLLAIPLGLLIGRARWAEETLFTPLEILRPIPGVAWIPLAILMFATSEQSMIFICFIGAFFPILISTIHGVERSTNGSSMPRRALAQEPGTRLMMQELLLNVWSEYRMIVLFVTHDIDEAVYLGSRVAVLTRRPGRLKALFDVDLPRPRTVDVLVSKEFMKLKRSCMDLVREETLGFPGRKERPASEADFAVFLAESADAAV